VAWRTNRCAATSLTANIHRPARHFRAQAKDTARLHTALDALTAIDPATLSAGDRDDREILINSIKGTLLDVETIRYWQKDPDGRNRAIWRYRNWRVH
jgi:hypothetical protein